MPFVLRQPTLDASRLAHGPAITSRDEGRGRIDPHPVQVCGRGEDFVSVTRHTPARMMSPRAPLSTQAGGRA
jgi:hypothetical protein